MPTRGRPLLYRNLLLLGACSSLPAGCGALLGGERGLRDGGHPGGAHAMQARRQREREGATYDVTLSFLLTGFDYASLADSSQAVASLTAKIADSICGTLLLPAAQCKVTLKTGAELAGSISNGKNPCHRQRDSKVVVEVNIPQSSLHDAQAITAEIEANKDTITSTLLLSTINDDQIMDHENGNAITIPNYIVSTGASEQHSHPPVHHHHDLSNPGQDTGAADFTHPGQENTVDNQDSGAVAPPAGGTSATVAQPQPVGGASTGGASAQGDPHLASVNGQKFDVNMPGSYVLIRAPLDRRLPAKLELNATLQPSAGSPCGLYIKSVQLGGEWLGDQVASVVPLQRNVEGENGAGNSTLRPFSVRVQAQRGALRDEASGAYEQWGDLLSQPGRSLSGRVRLVPVWRQVYADADRTQEAQAFHFKIRGDGAGHGVTLEAAQAAHQALDVRADGLRSIGFEEIGGLLGTEEHDRHLEQQADACKTFRVKAKQSRFESPMGSYMAASWDEPA